MIRALAMGLAVTGCTVSAGLGTYLPDGGQFGPAELPAPVGVVRAETDEWHRLHGECTHLSSVPRMDDAYGLNWCSVMIRVLGGGR